MTESNRKLHARPDAVTMIIACAVLGACVITLAARQSSGATVPMSSQASMGPVYFGDTMSFGLEAREEKPAIVAGIQLKY